MNGQTVFEPAKAVAAVAYLAKSARTSMYPVMKMMYLADRRHLERYGRFIAGDQYVAMAQGPVPSHTYDLLKAARGERRAPAGLESITEIFCYGENHALTVRVDPDFDELSRSDIECLDDVLRDWEMRGREAVVNEAHDAAWKAVRDRYAGYQAPSMSVEDIASVTAGSVQLLTHLADPNPGDADAA